MRKQYYFSVPGKEGKEAIVLFSRRHIMSIFSLIVTITLLLFLPIIIWNYYLTYLSSILFVDISVQVILLSAYYLILSTYCFAEWINYYYDVLIVTSKTMIDIKQINLFNRHISHIHLMQIRDIQSDIKGFIPTIFSYGNVIIETAGSEEPTIIEKIPYPQRVAATIHKLHKAAIEGVEFGGENF